MIICVTGATGFIGRQLCVSLLDAGYEVRALVRGSPDRVAEGVRYFSGDISLGKGEFSAFLCDVDVLFNCAGEISKADEMFRLHVDGTINLISFVQAEINIREKPVHWVQLSSVGAYGISVLPPSALRIVDVTSAECPENVYEITKTASDHLLACFSKQNNLCTHSIVRPSIVIGPTMSNQSFFQLANIVRKKLFFYVGGEKTMANYVHVDDVVAALQACAFGALPKNNTYIVANDCPLMDVVAAISDFYRVANPKFRLPEWLVRLMAILFSKFKAFPLTQSRIDALLRRTTYISNLSSNGFVFSFSRSIPESVASILEGRK